MASSRKQASADVAVGLSGGVDSVVLLHLLGRNPGLRLQAIHVHHGLSPNADSWTAFCRQLCKRLAVPLTIKKIRVVRKGKGLEAAARAARYKTFGEAKAGCIALAHNLDDQAETVLMNLLRGAGARALRRQDALAPAPRHAAQRDRSLRAPAPPRLDRGREQRRRSADAQLHPPPHRAAARAEVSALEGEPRARRAAFLEEGSGRRRAAAPLPSFKGAPSAERSEAHRDAEAARLGQPAREARARRCDAAD